MGANLFYCLLVHGEVSIKEESMDVQSLAVGRGGLEALFGPTFWSGPTFAFARQGEPEEPQKKREKKETKP
jgi:hypothetical protein